MDEAYNATTWNGNLEVPTKNAVRDKIESMSGGGGATFEGVKLRNSIPLTVITGTPVVLSFDTEEIDT